VSRPPFSALTRRDQLALFAALAAAGCAGAAPEPGPTGPAASAAATPPDPLAGDALYADLVAYTDFGPKQTGTPADHATSRWLHGLAAATGADAQLAAFGLTQFRLERAALAVDGKPVDVHPFWFPVATPGVVRAALAPLAAVQPGGIAVATPPAGLAGIRENAPAVIEADRRGAAGLVIVSETASGELFGHGQGAPVAVPTLLAGSKDRAAIEAAMASGAPASLEIAGAVDPDAEAFNVVARVRGEGPLLVVSTPTSAWFASAGERGPGVALWLGLLRLAMRAQRRPNALFVAFSGHEMGAAGARAYIDSGEKPAPADVAVWMHLGASIATYRFERDAAGRFVSTGQPSTEARLLTNSAAFDPVLARRFAGATPFTPQLVARPEDARGELQLYFGAGYNAFGFEGGHSWFHAPSDLAFTSGPDLLEPVARAIAASLGDLGVLPA
jgi:hypothetical protein